jgi:hypothetical protein
MDAISSLRAGMMQAQAQVNGAAQQLAGAGLPSPIVPQAVPGPTGSAAPSNYVDVARQLTTLMVGADAHHITTAAMRVALSTYQDAADVGNTQTDFDTNPPTDIDSSQQP